MNAIDPGKASSPFYWWRRRHPALTAFVCGVGAPFTLLACGAGWMREVSLSQQELSGPQVIQERVYASVILLAGMVALAALITTGHAVVSGEDGLYTRLFARWYNGVSTLACAAFFVITWVLTYLHLADDD